MNRHRLHELSSLEIHRVIAKRLLREPSLIDEARRRLESMKSVCDGEPCFIDEWTVILGQRHTEIARLIVEDTPLMTRLRQSSPLSCVIQAEERREIRRQVFGLPPKPRRIRCFSEVTREHYITSRTALNWGGPQSSLTGTTGDWRYLTYFSDPPLLLLAGIEPMIDTRPYLGETGVYEATDDFVARGFVSGSTSVWVANHYRAAADMLLRDVVKGARHSSVDVAEWFLDGRDVQALGDLLEQAFAKLRDDQVQIIKRWLTENPE